MWLDLVLQEDDLWMCNGHRGQSGWKCAIEVQPWSRPGGQGKRVERQSPEAASNKLTDVNMNGGGVRCLGNVQPEPSDQVSSQLRKGTELSTRVATSWGDLYVGLCAQHPSCTDTIFTATRVADLTLLTL